MEWPPPNPNLHVPAGTVHPLPTEARVLLHTSQTVPRFTDEPDGVAFAPSKPLDQINPGGTRYLEHAGGATVTNDESARDYVETAARVADAEFQQTRNRVAIIIGEGALVAALPYIPEDTVILADYNWKAVSTMDNYTRQLATSPDYPAWFETVMQQYALYYPDEFDQECERIRWQFQIDQWNGTLGSHPATNRAHFRLSQEAARRKTIVPYLLDIRHPEYVAYLGDQLRQQDATVTFMNITNVADHARLHSTTLAATLALLPVASTAPILATSNRQPSRAYTAHGEHIGGTMGAIGPFFGLQNLGKAWPEALQPGYPIEQL